MRKTGLETIYALAKENEKVIFIGSDLGPGTLDNFKNELPHQFIMEGISEAHIISMASGLAQEGYKVYVNTIATFFARRAFEQIALDINAEDLDIVMYSNGGGLVYGPLGHSHTAVDDFALMYPLSNITILAPSDAHEMHAYIKQSKTYHKPIYIRLGKGGDKLVTQNHSPVIGKAIEFNNNSDTLICTCGVMLQRAFEITKEVNCDILHFGTIQPLDTHSLLKNISKYRTLIILEEHLKQGGLGSRIKECLFENSISHLKVLHYHLGTSYIKEYGRQEELFEFLKIDPPSIIKDLKESL